MSSLAKETTAKRLLITGSSGFLGRHWLEALRSEPAFADLTPVCLARDPAALRAEPWFAALGETEIVQGDLQDASRWQDAPALRDVCCILHGAAVVSHSRRGPEPMFRANVDGTLAMVRLAAHLQARLVFVSSSGTVGASKDPAEAPFEDASFAHQTAGAWPYYASKIRAEEESRRLAEQLGVDLVVFRPPVMLGPGDHRFRSTGNIIRHLRQKLPFLLHGGIHFIDVRDAARAMIRAAFVPSPSPVYHLVGTSCTVPAFFGMVAAISGVPAPKVVLPAEVARRIAVVVDTAVHTMPGDRHSPLPDPVVFEMGAHHWGLSSTRAEAELDYHGRPGIETLRDTIAWLRRNHPALDRRG